MSTCIAIIADCQECTDRRNCDGDCDDLCRMLAKLVSTADGHESWHRSAYCSECGARKTDAVRSRCRYGRCNEDHCVGCGVFLSSDGPVNCRCTSTPWRMNLLVRWRAWRERRRP